MFGQTFGSEEPCEGIENYANAERTGSVGNLYEFALILSKPQSNNALPPK